MIQIIFSFFIFTTLSPTAFAAGANETLFAILSETGFAAVTSGANEVIAVENVYCEEKSAKRVKCTASQKGTMLNISDSRLFLDALRGDVNDPALTIAKKIYTFKALECTKRTSTNNVVQYACGVSPLE